MEIQPEIICPQCNSSILFSDFFCPNCGKQLKDKLPSATLWKQIVIYSVSLFLPPFGLWYAWKYYRAGDQKSKTIAVVAVVLTIGSILITVWYTDTVINSVNQQLNSLNI